jgi:hypothetical protein
MEFANRKREENIVEYLLFMYQMEDVMRAFKFDIDGILDMYGVNQSENAVDQEMQKVWYIDFVRQMKRQGLEQSGHLSELTEILTELSYLHNTLMNLGADESYRKSFATASAYIDEFKAKTNLGEKNQIEVAVHAMYMKLLMRLRGSEISAETEEAFESMRHWLSLLAYAYKRMKAGDLNFLNN